MTKTKVIPVEENEQPEAYVRLARTEEEIHEAQKLRYDVFYKEYGATPSEEMKKTGRDFDEFDSIADHLIVIIPENGKERIVGTYRLLRQDVAAQCGGFYSSTEYDLTPLLESNLTLLELGRSCVLADFRTKPILNLLWEGIARYINKHKIDLLFGCASFQGTDTENIKEQLSYLHHFHTSPRHIRPKALENRYIDMNLVPANHISPRTIFASLPPLIKGYLRVGATIGDGAVIDEQFNTIDVCIIVQTSALSERYRRHYERKIQKPIHGQPPSPETGE